MQNSRFDALVSGNKSVDTREGEAFYSFDKNSDDYAKEIKTYNSFKFKENWEIVCDNQDKDTVLNG